MFEALKKYAVFSGRARRKEYWLFMLFYFIAMVVAALFDDLVGVDLSLSFAEPVLFFFFGMATDGWGVFSWIVFLGLLIPEIAVSVRRLHDINFRGWWLLVYLTVIGALVIFIFACIRGTDGENRFGADPLAGVR